MPAAPSDKRIHINWEDIDRRDDSGEYIYPDSILNPRALTWRLHSGWTIDDFRDVQTDHKLISDLPLRCRGEESTDEEGKEVRGCDFRKICPLVAANKVSRFLGKPCPLEIIDIFHNFTHYVNELGVAPDDHVDLVTVVDLCRVHINMSRCDKILSLESPIDLISHGTDIKTTVKVNQRGPSPAHVIQHQLREDRVRLYDQLTASREAKAKAKRGTGTLSPEDMMAALMAKAKEQGATPQESSDEATAGRFDKLEVRDGST